MTNYGKDLAAWKRRYIIRAIREAGGNQQAAASMIHVHRNTISRILREAGINHHAVTVALNLHHAQKGHAHAHRRPDPQQRRKR